MYERKNDLFAVVDTNVIVSGLISSNKASAVVLVFEAVMVGIITPVFNNEILAEYAEVLNRDKFCLPKDLVSKTLKEIQEKGVSSERVKSQDLFEDENDRVFYEVVLSKQDAYLVTGNKKQFPQTFQVVTPAEMLDILNQTNGDITKN